MPAGAAGGIENRPGTDLSEETAEEGLLAGQPLRPVHEVLEDVAQLKGFFCHGPDLLCLREGVRPSPAGILPMGSPLSIAFQVKGSFPVHGEAPMLDAAGTLVLTEAFPLSLPNLDSAQEG